MRQPSSLHHRSVSRSVKGALFAAVFAMGVAPAWAQTSVEFMQQAWENTILPGERAQLTYVIVNTGAEAAVFPQVYGTLPGGGNIEWMSGTPGCHTYGDPPNQTLECDFNYLAVGDFQYAEVHGVPTECTVLESVVTVSGENFASQTEQDVIVVACSPTGQMTGSGNIVADGVLSTHSFALSCDAANSGQNLDISWSGVSKNGKKGGKKDQNKFRLSGLTTADCINDPMVAQTSPAAGFNTFVGGGVGTCNGEPAEISFVFTEGAKDTAEYHISGGCTLAVVETDVTGGKQQARKN